MLRGALISFTRRNISQHNINFAASQQKSVENNKNSHPKDESKLYLSDSCTKRLNDICEDGSFLRLTVEGGGCSGFTYKFELDKKLTEDDQIFGSDKGKVVVDSTSLEYCGGATIDYHAELIRTGFKIVGNPKAEAGCSCGSSFAIRLD